MKVVRDALVLLVGLLLIILGFSACGPRPANAAPERVLEPANVRSEPSFSAVVRPWADVRRAPVRVVRPTTPASIRGGGWCSESAAVSLASAYSWDLSVATAVMDRETGGRFCSWAVNPASGTSGLFQLAPFWWDGASAFGWIFDPLDPAANVAYAFRIYSYEGGWAPAWCANIDGLYDPPGC